MALDLMKLKACLAAGGFPDPRGEGAAAAYTALFACAAGRRPDATMAALGTEAARLFPQFGMNSANRIAEFVAQTANETGGYRRFSENLNYSAQGLANTWPTRFAVDPKAKVKVPNALALKLQRRPEEIANTAYARPAEGNTAPGDGWKYRGRGMLQITFKNNYARASRITGLDLVAHPDLAADPVTSLKIALDFWRNGEVNACCDASDFYGARGLTNCGTRTPAAPPIGLAEVERIRGKLLPMFA